MVSLSMGTPLHEATCSNASEGVATSPGQRQNHMSYEHARYITSVPLPVRNEHFPHIIPTITTK